MIGTSRSSRRNCSKKYSSENLITRLNRPKNNDLLPLKQIVQRFVSSPVFHIYMNLSSYPPKIHIGSTQFLAIFSGHQTSVDNPLNNSVQKVNFSDSVTASSRTCQVLSNLICWICKLNNKLIIICYFYYSNLLLF